MKKFGLIGKSLGHSFSKEFFTNYFQDNDIDAEYSNLELSSITEIENLKSQKYSGFNVTIPYKEEIIPFLDHISKEAKVVGAVNVVKIKNGEWIGYNSDVFGFQQLIKPFLTNKHERAIIFGTGGASKAIEYVLKEIGVDVIFVSRTPKGQNQFSYADVNENMISACKLIVNCTPIGTFPNIDESIDIPFKFLTSDHLVIDLIYNPSKTKFLELAEENGAQIQNGETMLKQQALKSWELWSK